MKKSIIAIAIAAAAAAPIAANAAGTAYAKVQVEIASIDNGTDSAIDLNDNSQGMFGFKGSEELGNGLTMIGKMEFGMDTDVATLKSNRQAYVGMKAGFGTVMMGQLPSPYKYAGGVKYDAFVATHLQSRGTTMSASALGHNSFQAKNLGARLMDGKLAINYGIAEEAVNAGDITVAYKHKMGKNEVQVAHVSHSFDAAITGSGADYSATKVAGKFAGVKFQVESIDADGDKGTNLFVAYSMKAAGGSVVIQGGQSDFDSMTDATTDVTVGYIKKFTKKARYFVGARSTDGDSEATVVTYGMRFDY